MQIKPDNNPYRPPNPEPEKEKPPFFKPFIKKAKRAVAIGTLLSAPSITVAALSAEYHDGKPTTVFSLVEHLVDWTVKLTPFSYGIPFLAEFGGRKPTKKED